MYHADTLLEDLMMCPNKEKQEGFNCATKIRKFLKVYIEKRPPTCFCVTLLCVYTLPVDQNCLVSTFKQCYVKISRTQTGREMEE